MNNNINSSATEDNGFYYGWVILAICLFLGIIAFGFNFSFGIFFKYLESDFNMSRATTSAIFSGYMIVSPFAGLIGGWIQDRYGPRLVISVMGLLTFTGLFLLSRATETWHLFAGYSFLLATGTGGVFPIVMAMAAAWFKRRRGLAIGVVGCGVGAGILIMSPISAFLLTTVGWRESYFILSIVGFVVMVPFAWLLKMPPKNRPSPSSAIPDMHNHNRSISNVPSDDYTLKQALKTRTLWLFFCLWTLYSVSTYIITGHVVRHAIDLGIAEVRAAVILTIVGGVSAVARIVVGQLSDTLGRRKLVLIGALCMAAAMLWLMFAGSLWQLYLFGVIFGLAYGGFSAPVTALLGDTFGTRHLGTIIGIAGFGWCIGGAVGPAVAGYIFDTTGSYFYGFLFGVVTSLISASLVPLLTEKKRIREV